MTTGHSVATYDSTATAELTLAVAAGDADRS